MQRFLALALIGFTAVGWGQPVNDEYARKLPTEKAVAELQWIDHADVRADFQRNVVEKRDLRFIAVNGISSNMIRGGDGQGHETKFGFWTIQGTGDAMMSKEHKRLVMKALRYAEQYNNMLVDYLREHKKI